MNAIKKTAGRLTGTCSRSQKRGLLGGLLACGVLAGMPTAAGAFHLGVNPEQVPMKVPGTGQVVDAWKLVGKFSDTPGHSVSATQIHREWVMLSAHSYPPVGGTIQNAYGVAVVRGCWVHPQAGISHISLCRIDPLPGPTTFPKLLLMPVDGLVTGGGADWPVMGYQMAVGFGGPTNGTRSAAWLLPNHQPVGYHPLLTTEKRVPSIGDGDSGGALFWFGEGASQPVLKGILGGPTTFGPAAKAWVDEKTAGAIQWTTPDAYSPPRRPRAVSQVLVDLTTHDTARVSWDRPPVTTAGGSSTVIDDYVVAWSSAGGTPGYAVVPAAGLARSEHFISGLVTDRAYKVCAVSRGGGREANPLSSYKYLDPEKRTVPFEIDQDLNCVSLTPRRAPAAPTGLTLTRLHTETSGSNSIHRYRANWAAPVPTAGAQTTGYLFAYEGNGSSQTSLPAGQTNLEFMVAVATTGRVCAMVQAVNEKSRSPASSVVCD